MEALGAAAVIGWAIGSAIYDSFATEIQDGIDVVVN